MKKRNLISIVALFFATVMQANITFINDTGEKYFYADVKYTKNMVIFDIIYSELLDDTIHINLDQTITSEYTVDLSKFFSITIQTGLLECLPPIPVVLISINMPSKITRNGQPVFVVRKGFNYQLNSNIIGDAQITIDRQNTEITLLPEKRIVSISIPLKEKSHPLK